ncbi:acetyl-CoA synthetase-like protein [Panus rudis PR-1116 ss-1]|nr:acetyl-CoA synthetase-like protein [Panus rudis PR-1116 ss-1]
MASVEELYPLDPDAYLTLPIPPVPQTQNLRRSESKFKIPPLDGSLTLPEIYDWHLENSPDHPLFLYGEDAEEGSGRPLGDGGEVVTLTWRDVVRGIHRAGWAVKRNIENGGWRSDKDERPMVAILASLDFITYFTFLVGVLRAGYKVFFISPRNSIGAVAHLLAKTNTTHLFVGRDDALRHNAKEAIKSMRESNSDAWIPELFETATFEELYPEKAGLPEGDFQLLPPVKQRLEDTAIITHSSGSTAYPKPIRFTHYRYLILCLAPFFGELDKTGLKMSSHSMPMYHGMGMIQTAWSASCGMIITALKPKTPPIPITAENTIRGALATNSDIIFCVPTFVEEWALDQKIVEKLKRTQGIMFGGGPMSKQVGDYLTQQGVDIYNTYGIGECGIMSPLFPKRSAEWEYFEFTPNIKTHFEFHDSGYAEAYILPHRYHVPNVLNARVDGGKAAYACSDYLEPHPTRPGFWKIIDRVDNQIIHSTGEKTNPGPLETILHHDPHIEAAVMFGRGKFNAGVLIDPKPQFKFDPSDTQKLAEFRDKIWPSVEKVNEYAPQHSRIFKEMILVASPSKPFDYTAKFTARRQAVVALYEPEIESLYATVEETTQAELAPPNQWDLVETQKFVRAIVTKVLRSEIGDEEDLFQKGCDSLQATWIRNSIFHALRTTSPVNVRVIPTGFVYQNPTISRLAAYISWLAGSQSSEKSLNGHAKNAVTVMLDFVAKYGSNFPKSLSAAEISKEGKDSVVVTGTTGSLGASLLASLLKDDSIDRIFALNRLRREGMSLAERQKAALADRGLDAGLVDSSKLVLLESDMSKDNLGLPNHVYEQQIRGSVSHIIHNAYPVDWNLSLESFEPQVRTVRNFVDLALSSPNQPRLIFMSSVGVLRGLDTDASVKEEPVPPESAVSTGYSESKWVCETILRKASESTPLRPIIIRAGQISGNANGAWKTGEWFPSLVRSSLHLRVLPTDDKEISWIPADAAARLIVSVRNTDASFIHLAHPRPVPASTVIDAFAESLNLQKVPFAEWVDLLEKSTSELDNPDAKEAEVVRANPALKMLSFFKESKARAGKNTEAFGVIRMDTSKLEEASTAIIGEIPRLAKDHALSWLAYWKQVGLL